MIIETTFKQIGWSDHANDRIKVMEGYTPSNDYDGCYVLINDEVTASSDSTRDAVIKALGEELGEWILKHMGRR